MKKKKNKKYEAAKGSLNDILKTLGPYIPKTPKIERNPEPPWESIGTFPIPQNKTRRNF